MLNAIQKKIRLNSDVNCYPITRCDIEFFFYLTAIRMLIKFIGKFPAHLQVHFILTCLFWSKKAIFGSFLCLKVTSNCELFHVHLCRIGGMRDDGVVVAHGLCEFRVFHVRQTTHCVCCWPVFFLLFLFIPFLFVIRWIHAYACFHQRLVVRREGKPRMRRAVQASGSFSRN